MDKRVFISYSRLDKTVVQKVRDEIETLTNNRCWIDLEGIESGNPNFTKEIVAAINSCPIFLFMLSDNSLKSENALKELNYAYKKAYGKQCVEGRHVVIVYIEDCELTDEFIFDYDKADTIKWADNHQWDKLISNLRKWKEASLQSSANGAGTAKDILDKAESLCDCGNYHLAYNLYVEAAGMESAKAQFKLGWMFEYGQGVIHDDNEAVKWYTKSANNGYILANCKLASLLLQGKGVAKKEVEAFKWYLKAAKKGNAGALCNLGVLYQYGIGTEQSFLKALDCFIKAAELGVAGAQYNLGWMYQHGCGIAKDDSLALEWYEEALKRGSRNAQSRINEIKCNELKTS